MSLTDIDNDNNIKLYPIFDSTITLKNKRVSSEQLYKFLKLWKGQDDIEDYMENFKSVKSIKEFNTLNYRIINELLSLIHQYGDINVFLKSLNADSIFSSFENKGILIRCLKYEIDNIIKLYDTIPKIYTISRIMQGTKNIVLYRGFANNDNHNNLFKLHQDDINKIIITPMFLSTSVLPAVAYNFTDSEKPKIMWKIIVSSDKFDVFYYSYLSEKIENIITLNEDIKRDFKETGEFLLNIGAKLLLIETKIDSDCILYIFQFIGWEDMKPLIKKLKELKKIKLIKENKIVIASPINSRKRKASQSPTKD